MEESLFSLLNYFIFLGCHPSERWGPTLSMVSPNKAILIGGQGEKQILNKDSVWSLNPGEFDQSYFVRSPVLLDI